MSERIQTLLLLLPMLAKKPGQRVEEVAKQMGLSPVALLRELDLLTMVGLPPFSPDDFVEIAVEEGRIYVELNQCFSAPPKLNSKEATALWAAAQLVASGADEAFAAVLRKLGASIPNENKASMESLARQVDASSGVLGLLNLVRPHIVERRVVTFDYRSLSETEVQTRILSPDSLSQRNGCWYLSGFCHDKKARRLFRLDFISNFQSTEVAFETVPEGPATTRAEATLEVVFSGPMAAVMQERFRVPARQSDGTVVVKLTADSPRWVAQWVLGFGGLARVISPPWAVRAVARAASRLRPTASLV
jgi:proteasome accessory factor C